MSRAWRPCAETASRKHSNNGLLACDCTAIVCMTVASLRVAKARRRRALPAGPPSMRVGENTRRVIEGNHLPGSDAEPERLNHCTAPSTWTGSTLAPLFSAISAGTG